MYKFENIKVIAKFETSLVFDRKSPFDGVLAYLYAMELKKEGKYEEFEDKRIELPFVKKTNSIYHTSWPLIKDKKIIFENNTIVKSFDKKLNSQLGAKPDMTVNIRQGVLKSCVVEFESILVSEVNWFICGDYKKIKSLLQGFTHFGKKSSLNFGKISELKIERIQEDYSLLDISGNVNRPLPVEDFKDVKSNRRAIVSATYPYWDKSNIAECYI
jgi:hypothetical protein